jgi:hypothetical protein
MYGPLPESSYAEAVRYFRAAAALAPPATPWLLNQLFLTKALVQQGNRTEASATASALLNQTVAAVTQEDVSALNELRQLVADERL